MSARTLASLFGHIYRIIGHHAADEEEIHIDTHLCPMNDAQSKCGIISWYPHNKTVAPKTVFLHLYAPCDVLHIEAINNYMEGIKIIVLANKNIIIGDIEGDITVEDTDE
ncbi:MAG: hypothetical protein ACRCX2_05765 [Paraclostridium sp.]